MRVLVTGGAGYIGAIAARILLDAGYDIAVLDTLERGRRKAVDGRATLFVGDVGDPQIVRAALRDCAAVIHLAGYAEVAESQRFPEKYFDNNVTRPTRMLEEMVCAGVRDIVFSSTCSVYGEPAQVPIIESDTAKPINAYGSSKLEFEALLRQYSAEHALRPLVLRYFNVVGALPDGTLGEHHDPESHIVPLILRAALSGEHRFEVYGNDYPTRDGTCVRDYIHVVDLVNAHRLSLEYLLAGGQPQVVNLGNGQGSSNLEVVDTCSEVTGVHFDIEFGPRRAGDPATLVASNDRAGRVLGWRPERGLREAVSDAWRWHRVHGASSGGTPESVPLH